eukprot:7281915-Pyramimonas_sp.AAC.1
MAPEPYTKLPKQMTCASVLDGLVGYATRQAICSPIFGVWGLFGWNLRVRESRSLVISNPFRLWRLPGATVDPWTS